MQAAFAVIAGAATYMQRRTYSADAFGGSTTGSAFAAPFSAVGDALRWLKDRIPGTHSTLPHTKALIAGMTVQVQDQGLCSRDELVVTFCGLTSSSNPGSCNNAGLRNRSSDDDYFQPLAGNNEDFDVDEGDAESPVRRA